MQAVYSGYCPHGNSSAMDKATTSPMEISDVKPINYKKQTPTVKLKFDIIAYYF